MDERSECKPDAKRKRGSAQPQERAQPSTDERSECKPDAKRKRDSAQPQERTQLSTDDDVLREGFRLAHRRLRLIFLDLLWKAIWFVLTIAALLLAVAWLGSGFNSIGWMDTGNRSVNSAIGYALLRQFWGIHRTEVLVTFATVLFLSVLIWFVLEAAFRARFPLPLGEGKTRV